jgi:uncharacterized protein YkwD
VSPVITTQPQGQTIASGQQATLSVAATGTAPLLYQWFIGSPATPSPIGGATGPSFTTPALTDSTSYWARVSNGAGSVDSNPATVIVTSSSGAAFEDEVLALVNQRRAAGAVCGGTTFGPTGPLVMNVSLRSAARGHSLDMATLNYFSHTSLDGRTFDQRIRDAGYSAPTSLGENIAAGYSTPQAVVDGWMTSSGHCSNIMSPSYKSIGIGYAFAASSNFRHYWTQDFGGQ